MTMVVASRVQRPESNVQTPASRVSRVQRPESSVQGPASRAQRLTLASIVQEFRYALRCSVALMSLEGQNSSATILRYFASDTAHIVKSISFGKFCLFTLFYLAIFFFFSFFFFSFLQLCSLDNFYYWVCYKSLPFVDESILCDFMFCF